MKFSVKVMKSYDYCHFEASLSDEIDTDGGETTGAILDELGIIAQKACDRQIERYTRYKLHCQSGNPYTGYSAGRFLRAIERVPELERTPEMKAALKAREDYEHWQRDEFCYEDDYLPEPPPDYSEIEDQLKLNNVPF